MHVQSWTDAEGGGAYDLAAFAHMPATRGSGALPPSLVAVFGRESLPRTRIEVDAQQSIYEAGEEDDALYLIESGQVKLTMSSVTGQDCLLAIYAEGEVFGESCFSNAGKRPERATAMRPTVALRVPRREFLIEIQRASALEPLVAHLASRVTECQTALFHRVTMNAERRLAQVLLDLADKFGTPDGDYVQVEQRISHEELALFVGTTRPRITAFMQRFRRRGIVEDAGPRVIRIHRAKALKFSLSERRIRRRGADASQRR